MKQMLYVAVGVVTLSACASTPGMAPVSKSQIAALEVALTSTVNLANTCLKQSIGPCGVVTTRAVIIADEHKAIDAFRRLQIASSADQPALFAIANEAITQLTTETPKQ